MCCICNLSNPWFLQDAKAVSAWANCARSDICPTMAQAKQVSTVVDWFKQLRAGTEAPRSPKLGANLVFIGWVVVSESQVVGFVQKTAGKSLKLRGKSQRLASKCQQNSRKFVSIPDVAPRALDRVSGWRNPSLAKASSPQTLFEKVPR